MPAFNGMGPDYASVANARVVAIKAQDESVTDSNTVQSDDALAVSVAANKTYRLYARLIIETTAVNSGLRIAFTGPASPSAVCYSILIPEGGWANQADAAASAFGDVVFSATIGGTEPAIKLLIVEGVLKNGSNAGTVTLQWALNTASGTLAVKAGSVLVAELLD